MKKYHFISGLPRSGSTLLSAILKQNPKFFASMSGPAYGMLENLKKEMGSSNEYSVFISDAQRKRIFRSILDAYYGEEFEASVIFDTSRGWCAQMPLLQNIAPNAKVIACVRDVSWIVDSFERFAHNNPFKASALFNSIAHDTVYHRVDQLSNGSGAVGYSYNALKQAFYGEYTQNLLLVQYESLTSHPHEVMRKIYAFIGEAPFMHDFSNLEFSSDVFDEKMHTPGLHKVRKNLEHIQRQSILPPDIFRRFQEDAFWRNPSLNTRNVEII